MSASSIRSPHARPTATVPLWQGWRDLLDYSQRSQAQRGDEMTTACFGKLTDLDVVVVKGLAASLTCSTSRRP